MLKWDEYDVQVELLEPLLGTVPKDREVYASYVRTNTEELEALLRLQAAVGTENDMTEEPTIVRASYPLGDGMQVVEYRGGTPLRVRFALDYGSTPWRDWDPDRDPDLREQRPPPKEL